MAPRIASVAVVEGKVKTTAPAAAVLISCTLFVASSPIKIEEKGKRVVPIALAPAAEGTMFPVMATVASALKSPVPAGGSVVQTMLPSAAPKQYLVFVTVPERANVPVVEGKVKTTAPVAAVLIN